MKIFVKVHASRTLTLEVNPSDTVQSVKLQIEAKAGIPCENQLILHAGFELDSTQSLSKYHIKNTTTLHVACRHTSNVAALIATTKALQERATFAEQGWRAAENARVAWSQEAIRLGYGLPTVPLPTREVAIAETATTAEPTCTETAIVTTIELANAEDAPTMPLSSRQKKRKRNALAKDLCHYDQDHMQ